jgi:hypothetical protein
MSRTLRWILSSKNYEISEKVQKSLITPIMNRLHGLDGQGNDRLARHASEGVKNQNA